MDIRFIPTYLWYWFFLSISLQVNFFLKTFWKSYCFSYRFPLFFKQKTAYEIASCLVGSEMCIRDSLMSVLICASSAMPVLKLTLFCLHQFKSSLKFLLFFLVVLYFSIFWPWKLETKYIMHGIFFIFNVVELSYS